MAYVVFEDLDDATETKVHRDSCRHYRERDREATTVRWHGPYSSHVEATRTAAGIAAGKSYGHRDAKCCI